MRDTVSETVRRDTVGDTVSEMVRQARPSAWFEPVPPHAPAVAV